MSGTMKSEVQLFTIVRQEIRDIISAKDPATLLKQIPGLSNHMLWVFGHLIRTTDFLILKLAGQPMNFPADLDAFFMKGSSPADWTIGLNGLKDRLMEVETHCQAAVLKFLESADLERPHPEAYKTSTGFVLGTLADSLLYNVVHEATHRGQLQLYNKLL